MGRLGRLLFVGDREETPTTGQVRGAVPEPRPASSVPASPSSASATPPPSGSPPSGSPSADSAGAPAWDPVRDPLPPGRARRTGQAVRTWSRGPSGRLVLPGALLLALIGVTAAAGALVLPATAPEPRSADAPPAASLDPTFPGGVPSTAPALPGDTAFPTAPIYPTTPTTPTATGGVPQPPTGRPADVLAGWAQQLSPRVSIPVTALQAYGYAELVVGSTTPSCGLRWTTLAALGYVESGHGSANGATLTPTGQALPPIIGLPLDGNGGRQQIRDTDGGQLANDRSYDRAVGPMQFIPSTWRTAGVDADNDTIKDPHDIDDAALAAANYLCSGARNLATPSGWWSAILSYNDVRNYATAVFDAATEYGTKSRVA
jgi:membrane-bound lytic murein transglycosylase B